MSPLEKISAFIKEHPKAKLHDRTTSKAVVLNITLEDAEVKVAYFSYQKPPDGYLETSIALDQNVKLPNGLLSTWTALLDLNRDLMLR